MSALHHHNQQQGFTLIELMIVVAIIGILSSIGISSYQTYSIRAQVTEGISLAGNAKTPVVDAYLTNGEAPADRSEAGLTANPADTQGNYVQGVVVENGRVGIEFGNNAAAVIADEWLYLTPYETNQGAVVWRCGFQPAPAASGGGGLATMGTAGGGNSATYAASTVDARYLPATCR